MERDGPQKHPGLPWLCPAIRATLPLMPTAGTHSSLPAATPARPSAWSPLRLPLFRNLLIADLVSDIGTFMQSVGAAWLMTSLTTSALYVALIQTATALPFFLFALPAGSIGDIVDRRKLILCTETWMLAAATVLAVTTLTGKMTPLLLLLLTFALSTGDALESPTWRAIFPELVSKEDLSPAFALNGIEFNLARAIGPGLAGVIVAAAGAGTAFALDAITFLGVIGVIARWKRPARKRQLPPETIGGATAAAIRFVRYSPNIRALLLRSACVIFFSSSFWALLPPVAKHLSSSSVGYGLLLGFFGVGAIIGAVVLQYARRLFSVEIIIAGASIVFAAVILALATLPILWLLCILMLFGGAAWTVFMSTFNTLIQLLAPDWVRARVLAVYLFVFQGSIAIGSTVWGFAAQRASSRAALLFSAAGLGASLLLVAYRRLPDSRPALDVWDHWKRPTLFKEPAPDAGPVLVTVEYNVDPNHIPDFLSAIYKYQRVRRRDGAVRWSVYYDSEIPGRYLESFLVPSWAEHQRQHVRFTVTDRKLEERVRSFVLETPKVRHFIYADKDGFPPQSIHT
jgi:MFS family permease